MPERTVMGRLMTLINPVPILELSVREEIRIAMPLKAIFPARNIKIKAGRLPWIEIWK